MSLMVQTVPVDSQKVDLHIRAEGVFSAETARRKANVWLLLHAGNLLRATAPELIINEHRQLLWRSPITLTHPQSGTIATIGILHINAETGHILESPATYPDTLLSKANALTLR